MIMFNDFIKKFNLRNKATSNLKTQHILSSLSLVDVGIYLRDGPFESDIGIVNLLPSKGTHWVCYINKNYFDSYGVVCPKNYLSILLNEKEIVYILSIRFKKMIVIAQVIVYIKSTW